MRAELELWLDTACTVRTESRLWFFTGIGSTVSVVAIGAHHDIDNIISRSGAPTVNRRQTLIARVWKTAQNAVVEAE